MRSADPRRLSLAGLARGRSGRGPQREGRAEPGVEVMIAECLLERRERGLARAVARRDVLHFALLGLLGQSDSLVADTCLP
jgi:hypothetical protein